MTLQVQSAKTDKLDVEVRKKIENMDVSFGRFDEIETQLKERVRGLDEQLASFEGKLEKSLAKIQSVENEVGRVDRITTALAIATAPGEEADQTRIEAARRGPPPSELGLGVLDALEFSRCPHLSARQARSLVGEPICLHFLRSLMTRFRLRKPVICSTLSKK